MPPASHHAPAFETIEMGADDLSFQLHKMGTEAGPLQFLRELTQNGIEAIAKTADGVGVVAWRPWEYLTDNGALVPKLSVLDTGCGMTAPEMEQYLNKLSSSGSRAGKSENGNFGIGAKITALRYNPKGVVYLSLKDGAAHRICLHRDPRGKYGVRPWASGQAVEPVALCDLPREIRDAGHGTLVILLGDSDGDRTADKPAGYVGGDTAWLPRALNARYLRIPEGVTLRAYTSARSRDGGHQSRKIDGAAAFLDTVTETAGTKHFADVSVHWRILREDATRSAMSGYTVTGQHVAAVRDNEVYELHRGNAGIARVRRCGVYAGEKNVVLHFEPNRETYVPNSTRSQLSTGERAPQGGGQQLPWDDWFEQFAADLPPQLDAYIRSNLEKVDEERSAKLQDGLRDFLGALGVSRLRRAADGPHLADPLSAIVGGAEATTGSAKGSGDGDPGGDGGVTRSENHVPASDGNEQVPAKSAGELVIPGFDWRSDLPHLQDRAAEFLDDADHGRGWLTMNADFRGFADLARHVVKNSGLDATDPAVTTAATRLVQDHFTQVLLESVLSLRHLRSAGGKQVWSGEVIERGLSPEALTLACLQRQDAAAKLTRTLRSLPELKVRSR